MARSNGEFSRTGNLSQLLGWSVFPKFVSHGHVATGVKGFAAQRRGRERKG